MASPGSLRYPVRDRGGILKHFRPNQMVVGVALLAVAAGLTGGGEPVARELQAAAAAVNREAREPGGRPRVVGALAALIGISPESILDQRATTGLGFGEIAIAHAIADSTAGARTFQQIVAIKRSGLGWGQVIHALGNEGLVAQPHLGQIVSHVRRVGVVASALREVTAATGAVGKDPGAPDEARSGKEEGELHESPGSLGRTRSGEDRGAGEDPGAGRGGR